MVRVLTLFLIFIASLQASAQQRLTNSRTAGRYTYIFKLSDKEALNIAGNGKDVIDDGFLHSKIDSFIVEDDYKKELSYGYYLYAKPDKDQFRYTFKEVKNVDLRVINNNINLQLYISDLEGNFLSDAIVKNSKGRAGQFDSRTQLYVYPYLKDKTVITVQYRGVNNYFRIESYNYTRNIRKEKDPEPRKEKKEKKEYSAQKYNGFLVFSKPKYKPGDTVKFKAYVVNSDNKAIHDIPAYVFIGAYAAEKKIGYITPYREGGYVYSFVLSDSLNLKLDRDYTVSLFADPDKKISLISRNFRFEDYELKSLDFNVRKDKDEYRKGSPVNFYLKATDENELTVPDGRVEVTVTPGYLRSWKEGEVFLPDTLWTARIKLDPVGETKLTLPDSIFPKADFVVNVRFNFLNSNNEQRAGFANFDYVYADKKDNLEEVKSFVKGDSLHLEYYIDKKTFKAVHYAKSIFL